MSEPKTKPTKVSAESYIAAMADEEPRTDAQRLVALMRRVTKQEPRMWGPSIVGAMVMPFEVRETDPRDAPDLSALAQRAKAHLGHSGGGVCVLESGVTG